MLRTLKNALKRSILDVHKLGIRFGLHILPVHYYSAIPNILELQRTRDIWAKKSELPGVAVDLDAQCVNLKEICLPYQSEYAGNLIYKHATADHFGPGYGYIEAQALHGFIRHYKPRRIIEVGSGVSTYCMLKAGEINARETGQTAKLVSIEPYPSGKLTTLPGIELITQKVQNVPFEVFMDLNANDLLFIDSSHTVKAGGDVNYLILEVLPRLRRGVLVHFHDIFLPYDYQRDLTRTFLHWAETSLLHAFLMFNSHVKIVVCLSHLHYDRRDVLQYVFPEYNPQSDVNGLASETSKAFDAIPRHFPSSTYLQIQ